MATPKMTVAIPSTRNSLDISALVAEDELGLRKIFTIAIQKGLLHQIQCQRRKQEDRRRYSRCFRKYLPIISLSLLSGCTTYKNKAIAGTSRLGDTSMSSGE